ncbi:hypothetical protein EKO04_005745 [Ascochyta lentis]|uniref:Cytochrome P450 n=1 Tax=Ascochyta lentis TaxID=205686 RepID=A0A8H7MJT9_9PLEO|nr:hypothetical protein EKO04_005745 [Ascochyta lentis]
MALRALIDPLTRFSLLRLAIIPFLGYILFIIVKRLFLSPLRHVPGPISTRLTGWALIIEGFFGRRVHALDELHRKYGDIVRVGPNEVSVADWRQLRKIYTNPKSIVKHSAFYDNGTFVGKHNLFQMSNPAEHAGRRKLSNPPYSLRSAEGLVPLIRQKAEDLARRLVTEANAAETNTADAYKLCGLFSLETICKASFAKDFEGPNALGDSLKLLHAMEGTSPIFIFDGVFPFLRYGGIGLRIPGAVGDAYRNHKHWEVQSRIMVDHFLEKSSSDAKYLLSPIANDIDSFLGRRLNHEELVEEAMGNMFAGSGTTSSTLTYLLYALSLPENGHIQERLYTEISQISPEDTTVLRENTYLKAVIKETFRRYPTIVLTVPRVLLEPLPIGEYVIPKGTVIGMQNWIHHRNPKVFYNPDEFIPERWLDSSEEMNASLTPFSIGRRNCIGQNLAWEELYAAVEILVRRLKFRLGAEMQPWEMEIEDRFTAAPRGHRLMLEVSRR